MEFFISQLNAKHKIYKKKNAMYILREPNTRKELDWSILCICLPKIEQEASKRRGLELSQPAKQDLYSSRERKELYT